MGLIAGYNIIESVAVIFERSQILTGIYNN